MRHRPLTGVAVGLLVLLLGFLAFPVQAGKPVDNDGDGYGNPLVFLLAVLAPAAFPFQGAPPSTWCVDNAGAIDVDLSECQALEDLFQSTTSARKNGRSVRQIACRVEAILLLGVVCSTWPGCFPPRRTWLSTPR